MTDLLPCPFCGSTNLRYEFFGSQGFIECNECGTAGPCDERAANPICDYDAAYAAWNRRAAALRAVADQPEPEGSKPVVDYSRIPEVATEAQIRSAAQYLVKKRNCDGDLIPAIEYAIARWGHPMPQPVAVSERLPEPNTKVLAHYFNALGKGRTICAIWVPAKTRSDSYGDDDFTEYDEESDTFYWPEGWYEAIENWDALGYGYVKVDEGEVIYWQPLPKWPVHALPLPSGEVE